MLNPNHKKIKFEIGLTFGLFLCSLFAMMFFLHDVFTNVIRFRNAEVVLFLVATSFILYGNIVYHLTRIGFQLRLLRHKKVSPEELELFSKMNGLPVVTYLIPAYKEEVEVIMQTVWSAVLQNYPKKRIVLLIDNQPNPTEEEDRKLLADTRAIPQKIKAQLKNMNGSPDWFVNFSKNYKTETHADRFFLENIISKWIDKDKSLLKPQDIAITTFERKKDPHLSHEPNKAMNINCYLFLMGHTRPDSKYVITLDADSMLLPDYTLKLVNEIEKPQNNRVAVIQTPYSAYPGASSSLERIAGATTDIQYNIHQGYTYFNSTYWVGANALIRKEALNDIKIVEVKEDVISPKYIQDRTVIEDTESTIDLVHKGWQLYNFPERLAFSSTPPDFGSLTIQRARWANGGLIIFPKLLKYLFQKPWDPRRWSEFFVRANYLTSIAGVNFGTMLLLLHSFNFQIFNWWLPIASVPYYYLYARDLKIMGYKYRDTVKVYALNLILMPINIAGCLKSIEQGITKKKIPFKRTPKVGNRTTMQFKFVAYQFLLLGYIVFAFINDSRPIGFTRFTHLLMA